MRVVSLIGLRRALCVTVVVAAAGCGTQVAGGDSRSGASDDATALLNDAWLYYIDDQHAQDGIHIEGQFIPDRDGTTSAATLDMAGRSTTAYLYPPNWDTDQWPPDPQQSLRSGHAMAVLTDVIPACDGQTHDPPVISVPYRTADGAEATLRLAIAAKGKSIAETAAYIDDATRQFCSHDFIVTSNIAGNQPKGEAWARYLWLNPGPGTLTVMSKAWQGPDGARWPATAPLEVPADGQEHTLTVHGVDGVCDEPHKTPMSLGLLVVTLPDGDSKVIERPEEMREVCQTDEGVIPP